MKSALYPHRFLLRTAAAVACLAVVSGCTTVRGWFDGDDDEAGEPAALTEFAPSATVSEVWSANVGKGEGRLGARQGPVVVDGRVYAAAVEGGVRAFDLQTGAAAWHYPSDVRISGGPGAGDGLVVVGGLDGEVIALDAATGKLLENNKNPSPKTGQLDNRGSQFYLALYWAQELAAQKDDTALAAKFAPLAKQLADNEQTIVADGQTLWLYDVDLNQVTARKQSQVLGSTPAALIAAAPDLRALQADFTLAALPDKDGLQWVEAKPKAKEGQLQAIRVGFRAADKVPELAALDILDSFGQRSLLTLSKVEVNPRLAADAFRFLPPKGADVIRQ